MVHSIVAVRSAVRRWVVNCPAIGTAMGPAIGYGGHTRTTARRRPMAKPNYQFEKRQRELAKKQKKEEKAQRKAAPRESGDAALPVIADAADDTEAADAGSGDGAGDSGGDGGGSAGAD